MFLKKIVANTREELNKRREIIGLAELKGRLRPHNDIIDFKEALVAPEVGLIAEIKQASPSKGLIKEAFNPIEIATVYSQQGAAAISVLTDEKFFQGSLDYLQAVRKVTELPLLRKDFIIDPYQVYEAQVFGADAILLIVNILTENKLRELLDLAKRLGLASLVEVHTAKELETATRVGAEIIGINNRNLKNFTTDIKQTLKLKELVPQDRILISESGISNREDIERLITAGIDGVLVGESLMRSDNLEEKVCSLLGKSVDGDD
ncbi:indole-3-glycerol phosphate synthase TrpC [Selenihalanaerobacter shriftii]|uniref:Indole-3-glycerol phosphate synthase n=1 Tax=Selenihalanaerobacter shriftii TaxID=142842 RepID=A0A1T4JPH1_9FIRM|nr:indole-3-glycerol phosphate synthase TrpC [Selenihalanaerobacter shriftii]SJZ32122.1 indole-3-glycerol phosphate synthase [Selenihalanaerobacter shriftii]